MRYTMAVYPARVIGKACIVAAALATAVLFAGAVGGPRYGCGGTPLAASCASADIVIPPDDVNGDGTGRDESGLGDPSHGDGGGSEGSGSEGSGSALETIAFVVGGLLVVAGVGRVLAR